MAHAPSHDAVTIVGLTKSRNVYGYGYMVTWLNVLHGKPSSKLRIE